jgi:hypothetical protein
MDINSKISNKSFSEIMSFIFIPLTGPNHAVLALVRYTSNNNGVLVNINFGHAGLWQNLKALNINYLR